jgi:predicted  nucleic acid-binding Zn-ribbon protein
VKKAEEALTEAQSDLKMDQERVNEAAKAKSLADWKAFRNEADSTLAVMEEDLSQLEVRSEKTGRNNLKLKADYTKAKSDIAVLKERLNKRTMEFEEDMQHFDSKVSEKNQSFNREFKHDMEEFGKAFKDLFTDNTD